MYVSFIHRVPRIVVGMWDVLTVTIPTFLIWKPLFWSSTPGFQAYCFAKGAKSLPPPVWENKTPGLEKIRKLKCISLFFFSNTVIIIHVKVSAIKA